MPTLNIEGQSVQVDDSFLNLSPDEQNKTVDEIAQSLSIKPTAPVTAKGLAKAGGVGLGEGAISLLGAPADLTDLASRGLDYVAGTKTHDTIAPYTKMLGSENIKKKIEGVTGEFYKPQNYSEEIANTAGQFAPLAATGPGGLGRRLLTNVVAPTVGTEAAGALTKGTEAEPYARAAGAILGGAGASRLGRAADARAVANATPTVDELKQAARAQYQHPEVDALRIQPSATSRLADTITQDLQHGRNSGFRATNEPAVFNAVEELRLPQQRAATVADVDSVRQVLGNLSKERDAAGQFTRQAVAARRAIDHIDNFLPTLRQGDLLAGNAQNATRILDLARQNWGAAKRAELVQTTRGNAEINAASSHSGANIQNATKQAFKPLLKNNAAKTAGWNEAERAALNRVVRGTWTGHTARAAGNLLGGGGGLGMLAGGAAGYEAGGIPGAIATGLAGRGLKMAGNRSTANAVNRLDQTLRSRAPASVLAQQFNTPQAIAALQQANTPIANAILRAIAAQQQQQVPFNQPALAAP